ncbi:MAG TPA: cation:proton antiporter [Anaerolineales bacterium]|nr:cation:proton antiporter [Anaerolineales bacterium]
MKELSALLIIISAFGLIALASRQIGEYLARFKLPLISGFLFTGILAGPYLLNLVAVEDIRNLRFLNQAALAFIAFAAGGELDLKVVRRSLRSILLILAGQTVFILAFGILAFMLVASVIPFTQEMSRVGVLAAGILAATIMIARSPSSAYAIIKETRAKGSFTQNVLGATVLTDAVVIILFATAVSVADVMIEGANFNLSLLVFLFFEILLDIGLGIAIGLLLRGVMSMRYRILKGVSILGIGYGVFALASQLRDTHLGTIPVGIFSEPLLICMVAGFYVANFTRYKTEFHKAIEDMAPGVFVIFFTLVGAELELDVIGEAWMAILVLAFARLIGMVLGGVIGGITTRQPAKHNFVMGLALLTQAGVSVGLANEVGVEFEPWGRSLTTILIGVIVINQIVGPPVLKWALNLVGEAHPRAEAAPFDGVRDAYIFGLESQSLALTRQLKRHDWQVKIVTRNPERVTGIENSNIEIVRVPDHSLETLQRLEMAKADSIVLMLSDEENHQLCEKIYENFGTRDIVVRLNDRNFQERFNDLGALIVNPTTAIVSLLDHLVRSPVAASLLLGTGDGQDVVDVEVGNPVLNGVALRDLRLPLDTLILSVHRDGQTLISHGYTRLKLGDEVTVLGSEESLEEIYLLFEA